MRVTKQLHGYTMRLTDGEFAIISKVFDLFTPSLLREGLTTGERRSFSRRCGVNNDQKFLRVDKDRRGDL